MTGDFPGTYAEFVQEVIPKPPAPSEGEVAPPVPRRKPRQSSVSVGPVDSINAAWFCLPFTRNPDEHPLIGFKYEVCRMYIYTMRL